MSGEEQPRCEVRLIGFGYQCEKPADHSGDHGGVHVCQETGKRWIWSKNDATNRAWVGLEDALLLAFGRKVVMGDD